MTISFDNISANIRTPGSYIEFNNELAGATSIQQRMLIIAPKTAAGIQPDNKLVRVTDPTQAGKLFGRKSIMTAMIKATLSVNRSVELFAISPTEAAAGKAAEGGFAVNGTATKAGVLSLYIGGVPIKVNISEGDDTAAVRAKIKTAIDIAAVDLAIVASNPSNGNVVKITGISKGEMQNGLDLRVSYYDEPVPAGLTVTTSKMQGGIPSLQIQSALDAIADQHFNWICVPYTHTVNIKLLSDELDTRFGPMKQIGGRAFIGISGTHAEMTTFGNTLNSEHLSVIGAGKSPTPAYVAAAINMGVAAKSLSIDPARPLQTLKLPGMLSPSSDEQLDQAERNMLLYDGISTYTVSRDGSCHLERQITTYQQNDSGISDASFLDINTPETLERIRYEQRAMIAQKFPRHKLADDGAQYGAGQAIVTPSIIKANLLSLYRDFENRGWCEGFDTYKESLIVERDATDRNRVNWRDTPNLVNQARVFAGKSQFIV